MNGTFWNRLGLGLSVAAAGALSAEISSAATQKVPLPRPRPAIHAGKAAAKETSKTAVQAAKDILKPAEKPAVVAQPPMQITPQLSKHAAADHKGLSSFAQANVGLRGALFASRASFQPLVRPASGPFAVAPTPATSAADIALVKQVIDGTRKNNEAVADVSIRRRLFAALRPTVMPPIIATQDCREVF